ncbi:hypothetical protein AB0O31_15825 [Kitasatospora cineracea]|uniref:hypothetical protein n=1 Tax=Kitasatospora cineracea TaxID=88074 RepID=UPI003421DD32
MCWEPADESPGPAKTDFLTSGRYRAKQEDDLTRAHEATITNTIATARQSAAHAQQNAALAAKAAAAANDAAGYANDAQKSGTGVDTSATAARTSAAQAHASAVDAQAFALRAAGSATAARGSADIAYAAVAEARQSTENAHAATSDAAQTQAIAEADRAAQEEKAFWEYMRLRQQAEDSGVDWNDVLNGMMAFQKCVVTSVNPEDYTSYDRFADIMHTKLDLIGLVPGPGEAADLINCLWIGGEYLADYASGVDFGLSCFSISPIAGWASASAKFIKKFGKKALEGVEAAWGWLTGAKKGAAAVVKACARNSFPAGTLVLMGDGTTKPIEQIQVGESRPRGVEATVYTPGDLNFTELTVAAADKSQQGTVTATDHHPFWAQNITQWTAAADIRVGDTLRTDTGATA